jgi:hypothetical protein
MGVSSECTFSVQTSQAKPTGRQHEGGYLGDVTRKRLYLRGDINQVGFDLN